MPWPGRTRSMNVRTMVRISSSGGMKDQALVSMSTRELHQVGTAQHDAHDDPAAHGVAERSTGPFPAASRKATRSATSWSIV